MNQWICCQIGAREHYAVARALHRVKRMGGLYIDTWAGAAVRSMASKIPVSALRAVASRFHPDLADAPVRSWNLRSLAWELGLRYRWSREPAFGKYPGFIEVGRRFSVRVREALRQQPNLGPDTIFFAYDTGALESFEWCRERGIKCVLNQMDPNRVEVDLVREEEKHWPGWQTQSVQVPEEYFRRREREWALADQVIVNSEFSRQALIQQGVPQKKLVILPLSYEAENKEKPLFTPFSASRPLRVLWLGQVILRKGIQYLVEAAKLLQNENIQFDVVGPVGISKEAMALAPKSVTFHGRATRDQAGKWYQQADVFLLPTLSDGFALTQLEAMSYGVPVIATPCCGAVVTEEVDGFIVPPRDAQALARTLQRYRREPELLQVQRTAALEKSKQFSIAHLTENLLKLESSLVGH